MVFLDSYCLTEPKTEMMVFRCFYTLGYVFGASMTETCQEYQDVEESEEEPRPVEAPVRTQPPPEEVALQAAKVRGELS